MVSTNLQENLLELFQEHRYQAILDKVEKDEITPAEDPQASKIVAASLFQLNKYDDCLLWCEGISPSLGGDASFASMHGAVLRRLGRMEEAEKTFRFALENHPTDPYLRNNFANLLIDRQMFKEAESILEVLIKEYPKYEDAKLNFNRLNFQKDLASPKSDNAIASSFKSDISSQKNNNQIGFSDPLADAFSDDEVRRTQGEDKESSPNSINTNSLNLDSLPERSTARELQEILLLARQTIETNPEKSLQDCKLVHKKLGAQASVYIVAGEAYIRLKLFSDAELALLNALNLGSKDASVLLNLANLASMRGDQKLSVHWLEQLAQIQPDHPQLDAVKQTLFPNGVPSESSNPFQIHKKHQSLGNFA